jgi:hypothetical protein
MILHEYGEDGSSMVINMYEPWTECSVCGTETPVGWGLPVWNGFIVANDWPGEWGGVPACQSCWAKHERGELVEVATSGYTRLTR